MGINGGGVYLRGGPPSSSKQNTGKLGEAQVVCVALRFGLLLLAVFVVCRCCGFLFLRVAQVGGSANSPPAGALRGNSVMDIQGVPVVSRLGPSRCLMEAMRVMGSRGLGFCLKSSTAGMAFRCFSLDF